MRRTASVRLVLPRAADSHAHGGSPARSVVMHDRGSTRTRSDPPSAVRAITHGLHTRLAHSGRDRRRTEGMDVLARGAPSSPGPQTRSHPTRVDVSRECCRLAPRWPRTPSSTVRRGAACSSTDAESARSCPLGLSRERGRLDGGASPSPAIDARCHERHSPVAPSAHVVDVRASLACTIRRNPRSRVPQAQ
ncbi:hypothetical protein B0H10DRAFT_1993902 [Mycena sp. CBHHK59/15]|nr:hypothetical protein B0H10DRAFT_1993902 [Mycena sp. CBHHK59/15]